MDKVCVLMTTYNPQKYLINQLDSIFAQKNVEITVVIRDDCSQDKTYLNLAKQKFNIEVIQGEKNLGVGNNIRELLRCACNNKFEYYAYCDQDDVWMPDKLKTAVINLKKMNPNIPCVYYGNLLVTNEQLVPSHELFKRGIVKNSCGQSLAQVFLYACTSVFNYKMIKDVVDLDFSDLGFDSCLYYMGIWKGNICYDDIPHIYYRQHGDNVSGVKTKGIEYFLKKILNIRSVLSSRTMQYNARFILKEFKNIDSDNIILLRDVANYKSLKDRINIMFNKKIRAGYYPKEFYRIIRLLLNCY